MTTLSEPRLPTLPEIEAAKTAVEQLRDLHLVEGRTTVPLRAMEDGAEAVVNLPRAAFDLLLDMLSQLASGHAVTIVPVHAELTTQQAADLLNVSRPFLISLLEQRKIAFRRVGNHRRVRFEDVIQYRRAQQQESKAAMVDLAAEAQRLNLGY
jgi:excisionase family DNA binding protein